MTIGNAASMPDDLAEVLTETLSCEVATIGRDGTPVAWPMVGLYLPDRGQVLLTTSIGFPAKAANLGRDPRVSLLFSDPTGSGRSDPPVVLVQGDASVAEGVRTWGADLGAHWARVNAIQPASRHFSGTPPVRWFMDWYYMRLLIYVTPSRVTWWSDRDTTVAPHHLNLSPTTERPPEHTAHGSSAGEGEVLDDAGWDTLADWLGRFPDAVLTGLDGAGRPAGGRGVPRRDPVARVLRWGPIIGLDLVEGPASVLCHSHDAKLWTLASFVVRGHLSTGTAGEPDWVFTPRSVVAGTGMSGALGDARSFWAARLRAGRYLARRRIPRPSVPWDTVRNRP